MASLMTIPHEVRDQIFSYLLCDAISKCTFRPIFESQRDTSTSLTPNSMFQPLLLTNMEVMGANHTYHRNFLLTCRQLRDDYSSAYWKHVQIHFHDPSPDSYFFSRINLSSRSDAHFISEHVRHVTFIAPDAVIVGSYRQGPRNFYYFSLPPINWRPLQLLYNLQTVTLDFTTYQINHDLARLHEEEDIEDDNLVATVLSLVKQDPTIGIERQNEIYQNILRCVIQQRDDNQVQLVIEYSVAGYINFRETDHGWTESIEGLATFRGMLNRGQRTLNKFLRAADMRIDGFEVFSRQGDFRNMVECG